MSLQQSTDNPIDIVEITRAILRVRAKTLSLYKEVTAFQPYEESEIFRSVLEALCEQLVDYSGKIHFSLLNVIETDSKHEKTSSALVENTQKILDFQDAYNSDVELLDLTVLNEKMNLLGEVIADRIALEDELLDTFSIT